MPSATIEFALRRLLDRAEIEDALCRYARAVDRGDRDAVRAAYHDDAFDAHGDYAGGIDGLVAWLALRFAGVDNSMHFLGNCLIEFAGEGVALVETYFVSRRLRPPTIEERGIAGPRDAMCREAWGRHVDRFERRNGEWRVAHRTVVLEASSTSPAIGGVRDGAATWGRDGADATARTNSIRPASRSSAARAERRLNLDPAVGRWPAPGIEPRFAHRVCGYIFTLRAQTRRGAS